MGDDLSGCERIEQAVRTIGLPGYADVHRLFGRLHSVGKSLQGDRAILVRVGEIENSAILGRASGRFVRAGVSPHTVPVSLGDTETVPAAEHPRATGYSHVPRNVPQSPAPAPQHTPSDLMVLASGCTH